MNRTTFLVIFFATVMSGCTFQKQANAQGYPSKPLRLIVPFAAGGTADIINRAVANQLTNQLGQQVIVDNRTGAGSVIGSAIAAKANADGYTLLNVGSAFAISKSLHDLPFDPIKDLAPVAKLGTFSYVLTVNPSLPAKSVGDLIKLARERPGTLGFGAAGVGSFVHLASELFRMAAGIEVMMVQYKGGGLVLIDLLGGHNQAYIGGIAQLFPHIRSGKLRALGTTGAERSPILPNVPTIAEAGVPGYEATNWAGLVVPAGTPKPVIGKLNKELLIALKAVQIKKLFVDGGGDVTYLGPARFGPYIASEIEKWARVVKEAKIKN